MRWEWLRRVCLAWQRIGQRRQAPVLREARHLEIGDMVDTWKMGRHGRRRFLPITMLDQAAGCDRPIYVGFGHSHFGTYVSAVDVFWCKPRIRAPWYRWRSQEPEQREVKA